MSEARRTPSAKAIELRKMLDELSLGPADLAERSGVDTATIYRFLMGATQKLQPIKEKKIFKALREELDKLSQHAEYNFFQASFWSLKRRYDKASPEEKREIEVGLKLAFGEHEKDIILEALKNKDVP